MLILFIKVPGRQNLYDWVSGRLKNWHPEKSRVLPDVTQYLEFLPRYLQRQRLKKLVCCKLVLSEKTVWESKCKTLCNLCPKRPEQEDQVPLGLGTSESVYTTTPSFTHWTEPPVEMCLSPTEQSVYATVSTLILSPMDLGPGRMKSGMVNGTRVFASYQKEGEIKESSQWVELFHFDTCLWK